MSPRLERRNYGRGHGYKIDGYKVPGVTTVLGESLPKPALIDWAARTTAAAAVDRWDELGALPPSQRLKALEGARWGFSPWHYRLLDVEAYAMGVLGWDEMHGLATIAEALGVDQPDHTAATDVRVLRDCFYRLRDLRRTLRQGPAA